VRLVNSSVRGVAGAPAASLCAIICVAGRARLTLEDSEIVNTTASGAALRAEGTADLRLLRSRAAGHSVIEAVGGKEEAASGKGACGGGLSLVGASTARLEGSTIEHNVCLDGGGACLADAAWLSLRNSTVRFNKARDGGGLYAWGTAAFELRGSYLEDNAASRYGGGVYGVSAGSDLRSAARTAGDALVARVESSLVHGNTAVVDGGGLYLYYGDYEYGTVLVANSTFAKNTAGGVGGCLYAEQIHRLALKDCSFTACRSETDGGAVYIANLAATQVQRTRFEGNRAVCFGGGIMQWGRSATVIDGCTFDGNRCVRPPPPTSRLGQDYV
jgi:hypothetical protein